MERCALSPRQPADACRAPRLITATLSPGLGALRTNRRVLGRALIQLLSGSGRPIPWGPGC